MQRDDKSALLALALLLLAIVILAFLDFADRSGCHQGTHQSSQGVSQQNEENGPPWEPSSECYQMFGDSAAQWLMALFTIIATGISLYAVIIVNRTLRTSQKATEAAVEAVTVTRKMGERQLRPYIVYQSGKISVLTLAPPHPKQLELRIIVKNCGATPAIIIAKSGALYGPSDGSGWKSMGGSWLSLRTVVGANQTQRLTFDGPRADRDGSFSWFSIGVLIWYESLSGTRYEDSFWLTFDGTDLRQDFPENSRHTLYRPQHDEGKK